jgi:hypothetical protein
MQRDIIDAVAEGVAAYCVCSLVRGLFGSPLFDLLEALLMIAAFSTVAFWSNRKFRSAP